MLLLLLMGKIRACLNADWIDLREWELKDPGRGRVTDEVKTLVELVA